jgi:hypothetical protein
MSMNTTNIKLGATTYRTAATGTGSVHLIGPRGGDSTLQQNLKNPQMWAHIVMSGYRAKTTWYRKTDAGAFEVVR